LATVWIHFRLTRKTRRRHQLLRDVAGVTDDTMEVEAVGEFHKVMALTSGQVRLNQQLPPLLTTPSHEGRDMQCLPEDPPPMRRLHRPSADALVAV
jgi:hypothetical protein